MSTDRKERRQHPYRGRGRGRGGIRRKIMTPGRKPFGVALLCFDDAFFEGQILPYIKSRVEGISGTMEYLYGLFVNVVCDRVGEYSLPHQEAYGLLSRRLASCVPRYLSAHQATRIRNSVSNWNAHHDAVLALFVLDHWNAVGLTIPEVYIRKTVLDCSIKEVVEMVHSSFLQRRITSEFVSGATYHPTGLSATPLTSRIPVPLHHAVASADDGGDEIEDGECVMDQTSCSPPPPPPPLETECKSDQPETAKTEGEHDHDPHPQASPMRLWADAEEDEDEGLSIPAQH